MFPVCGLYKEYSVMERFYMRKIYWVLFDQSGRKKGRRGREREMIPPNWQLRHTFQPP